MNTNAIEVRGLRKSYPGFQLRDLSFNVPRGSIVGFIGENGSGKTTTIKAILNMIHRDSGEIKVFGLDNIVDEVAIKKDVGVILSDYFFNESFVPKNIDRILKEIYPSWDSSAYNRMLHTLDIPPDKKIKELSKGMKAKLNIAIALSHQAKLLILDEPTSGLDPVVRDDMLDLFLDYIQNEENTIFISSHITGDLSKVADYIIFIHEGRIVFDIAKDELLDNYRILKCSAEDFKQVGAADVVGYRQNQYNVEALITHGHKYGAFVLDKPTLDDIMIYVIKGAKK